ncbi:unnamed protein product [Peniophora sp. CBMAI 1063]|nr:unnamed protein product [Peniophora sp. CBMAI 1063]
MGLFKPTVTFFGFTNSPAIFQATINKLFHDLIHEGVVVVHLDNILIFTKTLKEHCRVTQEVLRILQENKLYFKPEKCKFEQIKIKYLGMIIEEGHVCMDPAKLASAFSTATSLRTSAVEFWLSV